jgi:hypothetical protein
MSKTAAGNLYETDYYAWTREQADALRSALRDRSNLPLDVPNLVEEVEDLGRSERDTVRSLLRRIIEHCLKLEFSPSAAPRLGWQASILAARATLGDKMSPSLKRDAQRKLSDLYDDARELARLHLAAFGEHHAAEALPETCPYSLDELCRKGWFPQNRHGLTDRTGS